MKCNVLIVEDQRMPRDLLKLYVEGSENLNLAGTLESAVFAPAFCDSNNVNLILMDVMTGLGADGLEASETIKKKHPQIKIIVITSMPEASWLKRAKEIGVDSFWYKDADKNGILSVIEKTLNGEQIYPDNPPLVQIGEITNRDFTEREIEILREILTGDSNVEIAKRLNISSETVKFYVAQMLQKTGFHTRTELATVARALGIVIKNSY